MRWQSKRRAPSPCAASLPQRKASRTLPVKTQKGFPCADSLRHRKASPLLPRYITGTLTPCCLSRTQKRLSLSWLGTTEKGFPHAISGRHRKASLAMIQLSWRGPEELPGMDLPLTSRRLGLLPRISAVSTRYQHTPGDEWENSWRANRNGLAYNMDKTPRLATLEESAAAALEFTCLQRKPKCSRTCLRGVPDSYRAQT